MAFLTSKTFYIVKPEAKSVFNFYTADEKTNEDSTVYNRKNYSDVLYYSFIGSDEEAKLSARYIKLTWDAPKTKSKFIKDKQIVKQVFTQKDAKSLNDFLGAFNISLFSKYYAEYFSYLNDNNKRVVVGKEPLEQNVLITEPTTSECFHNFNATLISIIEHSEKDELLRKYYTDEPDSGYCGYIIEKEKYNIETKSWEPNEYIVINDPNILFYYDYHTSYEQKYRYRVATIYRYVYPNGNTVEVKIGNASITQKLNNKAPYYKEYNIGNFSEYAEGQVIDTTPPNSPEDIRVIPDKETTKKFILLWNHTEMDQKDIDYYVIYKRANKIEYGINPVWEEPIKVYGKNYIIEELNDKNDDNFKSYGYIYAIGTVDKHGLKSLLSRQIVVQFKQMGNKNSINAQHYKPQGDKQGSVVLPIKYDNLNVIKTGNLITKMLIRPGSNYDAKTYTIRMISDIGDVKTITINPGINKIPMRPETLVILKNPKFGIDQGINWKNRGSLDKPDRGTERERGEETQKEKPASSDIRILNK